MLTVCAKFGRSMQVSVAASQGFPPSFLKTMSFVPLTMARCGAPNSSPSTGQLSRLLEAIAATRMKALGSFSISARYCGVSYG